MFSMGAGTKDRSPVRLLPGVPPGPGLAIASTTDAAWCPPSPFPRSFPREVGMNPCSSEPVQSGTDRLCRGRGVRPYRLGEAELALGWDGSNGAPTLRAGLQLVGNIGRFTGRTRVQAGWLPVRLLWVPRPLIRREPSFDPSDEVHNPSGRRNDTSPKDPYGRVAARRRLAGPAGRRPRPPDYALTSNHPAPKGKTHLPAGTVRATMIAGGTRWTSS